MRYRALFSLLVAPLPIAGAQTVVASGQSNTTSQNGYVEADVRFMQGMIHHHAQALRMVALIPDHTTRRDMQLLGQRIAISQRDEIHLMQSWLQDHGQPAPQLDAHDEVVMGTMQMSGMSASDTLMPGMLTADQMAQLAKARGPEFDRLFLEGMIHHHEGALTMVDALFHTPGGGQASEVFRFASDVNADQRAEIARMQSMLNAPPSGKSNP
jgi:uncharacterized protein (DUF305 family)